MGKKILLEKLLKKGYKFEETLGPSAIYRLENTVVLYHHEREEIIAKTKVDYTKQQNIYNT